MFTLLLIVNLFKDNINPFACMSKKIDLRAVAT